MRMNRDKQEKMEKADMRKEQTPEIIVGTLRPPMITIKTENVLTYDDNSSGNSDISMGTLVTTQTVENVLKTVDNSPDKITNTNFNSRLNTMTVENVAEEEDIDITNKTDLNTTDLKVNTVTDLVRKRKDSPVDLLRESPVRKSTPLRAGRRKKDLTIGSEMKSKVNLITNHFQLYSSAKLTGGAGQAEQEAAGVRVGRDGGGRGGTVQATCADITSGLKWGGEEGSAEQFYTADTIGPDRAAEDISPNTGGRTIQLIRQQLQRGNGNK